MRIYEKICTYIERSGADREAVALRAGMTGAELDALLSGRRTLDAEDLRAICLALGVSPELFVEYQCPKTEKENEPWNR